MSCGNIIIEGCDDPLILPKGPIGPQGPVGPYGPTPVTQRGPQGAPGKSGRSKIDINFKENNLDYRILPTRTSTTTHYLMGTFIYPGNTLFGGDPKELRLLLEPGDIVPIGPITPGIAYISISLVNLNRYPLSYNDVDIINNYAEVTAGIAFYSNIITDESNTITIKNIVSGIDALPDTECLIGIYATILSGFKTTNNKVKFYSAELY